MMDKEKLFDATHAQHRAAQIKRFARETTPAQRLMWLEQALKFAYTSGIDCLAQKRIVNK